MLNKFIQDLIPVERSQPPAPTGKAESDACLKSAQLEELAKAAGKSGG